MKNGMYQSVLLSAFIITPCMADANRFDNDTGKRWQFEVGFGVEREPAYTGSDVYISEPSLDLEAKYQISNDKRLRISLGEIGLEWALSPRWSATAALEYEPGRENADDPILKGFDKVENTVEGQFSLKHNWGDTYVGAALQLDLLGRGKGLVGFVAAGHEFKLSPKLSVNAGIDVSFANAEHMNTEVGVTAVVSQVTGISAYETSSGYKSTTLNLDLEYKLRPRWSLEASLGYEYYGDEMASSPLIKDFGERGNVEVGAGLVYRF